MKIFYGCMFVIACVSMGCLKSYPAPSRYTLGLEEELLLSTPWPYASGEVSVTLSPDLQAMTMPYVRQPDGRVTSLSQFAYYAALPLLIEREIEAYLAPLKLPRASRLKVVVTDYCVDLRGETPQAFVGLKIEGNYLQSKVVLPAHYTPQDLRKAFATALAQALQGTP